jgi:AraC-like DNA-binding protein
MLLMIIVQVSSFVIFSYLHFTRRLIQYIGYIAITGSALSSTLTLLSNPQITHILSIYFTLFLALIYMERRTMIVVNAYGFILLLYILYGQQTNAANQDGITYVIYYILISILIFALLKVSNHVSKDMDDARKEAEALILQQKEQKEALPVNSLPCSIHVIVFHTDLLNSRTYDVLQEKFIEPLVKKQVILPYHIQNIEEWETQVIQHLTEIIRLNESKPHTYELITKALLYLIFSHIYTHGQITTSEPNTNAQHYKIERLKQILNYIHSHYHQAMHLRDLAVETSMSEEHLCRFFKQMMRKSPIEYINYYRMQQAAKLLEDSDKKVVEVAMDVGFANLSYFISVFKKFSGLTPSQYRKTAAQLEKEPRFATARHIKD